MIRRALAAGFGMVFGLWILSGYQLVRSLHDVEARVDATNDSFVRGERTLSTVRTNVLLGSIYLRDALIDTGPITRQYYRDELSQIRGEIEQRLREYLLEVQLPIEQQKWAELRTYLDLYWGSLDVVLSQELPRTSTEGTGLLRRVVVPARDEVLRVVDSLSALQQLSQQRHQVESSLLYGEVRTRFLGIGSFAIFVGLIVAGFAFWRVGGLERGLHRQRQAESHNRQDLERLSARLVNAQEDERRSLARELHDEVGQALTAIKMEVGVAIRHSEPDSRARASLEEARAIAETTLQSVRDLSQLLHPSTLDDFGLPETLTAYLRSFSKRTGIRANLVQEDLDGRLPTEVEVCIYRVAQEALTNIARHSAARSCSVTLARRNGFLRLLVEDDGRGIDASVGRSPEVRRGLGLIGMRERAQALSGSFVIENRREGGTRVAVTLPVPLATDSPAANERVAV